MNKLNKNIVKDTIQNINSHIKSMTIDLKDYPTDDSTISSLQSLIKSKCINKLLLDHGTISQKSMKKLAKIVNKHHSIHSISLSNNPIGNQGIIDFLRHVKKSAIKTFIIENVNINEKCAPYFFLFLAQNKRLRHLSLAHNDLTCTPIEKISQALYRSHLTVLNLQNTMLSNQGALCLSMSLKNNIFLKHLLLSYNNIESLGVEGLGSSLSINRTLETLQLCNNKIEDSALITLNHALHTNKSLENLDLSYNKITDTGILNIKTSIIENKTLRVLNLAGNNITDKGAFTISDALYFSENEFDTVDLSHNKITHVGAERILKVLLEKNNVLDCYLENNPIKESFKKKIQKLDDLVYI